MIVGGNKMNLVKQTYKILGLHLVIYTPIYIYLYTHIHH